MPTIPVCKNCERKGGYTSDVASELCERCIKKEETKPKRGPKDAE